MQPPASHAVSSVAGFALSAHGEDLFAAFEELRARLAADTIASAITIDVREEVLAMRGRIVMDSARASAAGERDLELLTVEGVCAVAKSFCEQGGSETALSKADALLKLCDEAGGFSVERLR